MSTFTEMGFSAVVTGSSATPGTDGYIGTLNGLPYHIHPTATPTEWAALEAAITADQVIVNAYVAPSVPAPTPDEVLAAKVAAGITITCTGNSALSATYALDDGTMTQIGSVARDQAAGMGLPGGASTFTYPDASGMPRTFTGPQIVELYKAQRDLLFVLTTQAAALHAGGTPAWPAQSATIA